MMRKVFAKPDKGAIRRAFLSAYVELIDVEMALTDPVHKVALLKARKKLKSIHEDYDKALFPEDT
jgi:hypothetical protein